MTDITFYHLTASTMEAALPKLLEKAYVSGQRALVVAESAEAVERLNQRLWTYDQNSFLAHGSMDEANPERQPVLLSTTPEPVNNAALLFITDGKTVADTAAFSRLFDLFDGQDADAVAAARQRWATYKEAGHAISYWKQTERGGWEKAA